MRPRDLLISVGRFPELIGSDPPGEVEKPHGVLEVEVRHSGVLGRREQVTGSEHAQLLERKPRLLKPRKLKPRVAWALVHRADKSEGRGAAGWGTFLGPHSGRGLAPSPFRGTLRASPRAAQQGLGATGSPCHRARALGGQYIQRGPELSAMMARFYACVVRYGRHHHMWL